MKIGELTGVYGQPIRHIHPNDSMYRNGNDAHYFSVGESAKRVIISTLINASQCIADDLNIGRILDFGCGYGRITRFLRLIFPDSEIVASDITEEGVKFCRDTFSTTPHISSTNLDEIRLEGRFDLIWLGSVITHLSENDTVRLMKLLHGHLARNGLLIVTSHGRRAIAKIRGELVDGNVKVPSKISSGYGINENWAQELERMDRTLYEYKNYRKQSGYGISLIDIRWFCGLLSEFPEMRLVFLQEAAFDQHHDVIGYARTPISGPRRGHLS